MNVYIGTYSRLPSTYQEVEYIESSGTQWIDTGVTPTSNTKSQIKFRNLVVSGATIYGMNYNDNTDYRFFNYNSQIYFDFNSNRVYGSTCSANVDYEFEIGNYYVKNVGASSNLISGSTISGYTGGYTIKLNYNDNNGDVSSNRWYYVKIRDGATQVRDLIPCYRKSDSVIGMYDTINDVFYTNSGSGVFTKGSNVYANVLKNAYIGEYKGWNPGDNTILYYPLTSDSNDYSGNGYNLSVRSGTITYSNYGADFSNGVLETTGTFSNLPTGTSARTVALRFKVYDLSSSETWFFGEGQDATQKYFCVGLRGTKIEIGVWGSSGKFTSNVTVSDNNYHCLIITFSGSTVNIYLDSFSSASGTGNITINSGNTVITAGCLPIYGTVGNAVVGRIVLENKIWSEDERLNYYNLTKSNYGL